MKVLFVCYGGGHVEMCLPVLQALRQAAPGCEARIMALTTAFAVAKAAGESPIGYRDFAVGPDAGRALDYGRQLLAGNTHPQVANEESVAYLGFNFAEYVDTFGEAQAWLRWQASGRQGFLPVEFFKRVLRKIRPDVLVSTNSPRSEQAAIEAAEALGIPSLSMVDLFALPGDPFLQRRVHATRITVLAESVRVQLLAAGVDAQRVVVTGNPAMDAMALPESVDAGLRWRQERQWSPGVKVALWAGHKEPADAQPSAWAGTGLGEAVQQRLMQWVEEDHRAHLAIRYHPNEWHEFAAPAAHPRVYWSRPDKEPLLPVLMGSDVVVVQATTVGAQAHAAGKRVIGLGFSPLVQRSGMDYGRLGLGEEVGNLDELVAALQGAASSAKRTSRRECAPAAPAVASLIVSLAKQEVQP